MDVQNAQMIRQLLPLVPRLGLDIVLRFHAGDAAEIPMVDTNEAKKFQPTPSTEPAGMIVKFEAKFDEQGRPGLLGLSADDLATVGVNFALPADTFREHQSSQPANSRVPDRSRGCDHLHQRRAAADAEPGLPTACQPDGCRAQAGRG